MHATEVVMKKVQRNLVPMILNFLAVAVREPRKTAHPHSHRKVLPLYVARRDVLRVRLAAQHSSAATDASGWAVARFRIVIRRAVDFHQHRVIYFRAEGIFNRVSIHAMTVGS